MYDTSEHNIIFLDSWQVYSDCNIMVSSTSELEVWLYYLPLWELVSCIRSVWQLDDSKY
jgi:hypothetical protein